MLRSRNWLNIINAALLPVIPMLFLYNQNARYLSFSQIAVIAIILAAFNICFFEAFRALFHSGTAAFFGCLIIVILLFAYNGFYYKYLFKWEYADITVLTIPFISYLITYIFNKIFIKKRFEDLPKLILFVIVSMLAINLFTLAKISAAAEKSAEKREYKESFITDARLPAPNVYWILCDGMLGFDAMDKYFKDPQNDLTEKLGNLGFTINRSAALESGHSTRIAVPELMCPEYCDKYLKDILASHEKAMKLNYSSDSEMFNARYHNELINAFSKKGYNTISMSLDEDVFFPTTDYFYYVAAHYTSGREYADLPYYVRNSDTNPSYFESKFYTQHLSDIFLGGIPDDIFNFFNNKKIKKHRLTKIPDSDPGVFKNKYSGKYSALVNSVYDSLYSDEIQKPKFTLVHAFMAHYPLCLDKNGDLIENANNIRAYPGQHAFSVKVLMYMVDMILKADPDAVIVLQADHGLHGQSKAQIAKAFGSESAAIDIWNNVFSAIRVPRKYQNGDEHYAGNNPLNISRYLINSYVGKNYVYR